MLNFFFPLTKIVYCKDILVNADSTENHQEERKDTPRFFHYDWHWYSMKSGLINGVRGRYLV